MICSRRLLSTIILSFILLTTCHSSKAQTCTANFHKTYSSTGSDEAFDILYTKDGGAIVTGRTTAGSTGLNGLLLKLNDQGNVVWGRSYGLSTFDELYKAKQTSDAGYVAIGRTSDAMTKGNAWVVRTDGDGNLLWSKKLSTLSGSSKARDVLQLPDGGFIVAVTINDSTDNSDASLVRLDAAGNLVWNRSYDNGESDGFYSLSQNGNDLMAVGYTTHGGTRFGMATKVDLSDGSVLWTREFLRFADRLNEVIRVDTIGSSFMLAFLTKRRPDVFDFYNNAHVIVVKVQNDSVSYSPRRMPIDAASLEVIGNLSFKFIGDSSFVFTASDSTQARVSLYRKVTLSGFTPGFGHNISRTHYVSSLDGIDPYDGKGVLLAGCIKDWSSDYHIQVLKTDWKGDTGPCTVDAFGYSMDTVENFSIRPFTWMQITSVLQEEQANVTANPVAFSENLVCKQDDCVPADAIPNDGCNATFVAEYWNKYQLVPFESVKVSDGYITVGYDRKNIQPMVMKIGFNGKMLWSKLWASNRLDCSLQHIRLMDDGNVLLTGPGGYTIDYYGYQVSAFIKMSTKGDLIWSKFIEGSIADLKPSGNGTFTGLLEYNMEQEPVTVLKFTIDGSGNVVSKKWLNKRYEIVATYRRIVLDGNYMYAAGEINSSLFLDKFDSSGNRIWSKRLQPDGKTAWTDGLYLKGDSIYLLARVSTPVGFSSKQNLAIIKVGKDGNGINALTISQDLVTEDDLYFFWLQTKLFHTTMTRDGNFVLADRIRDGADTVLAIIKFTSTGQVLWSKKFTQWKHHKIMSIQDDGSGLFIVSHRLFSDNSYSSYFYNPLLMHTDDNGDINNDGSTECNPVPFATTMSPISLTQPFIYWDPTPNTDWLNLYEEKYTPTDWPLQTIPFFACGIPANCSSVRVTGETKVCKLTDTVYYRAERNEGCIAPLSWRVDESVARIIKTTDSSCSIRFLKTGMTSVVASINTPCGNFSDSIVTKVLPSANSLDLGADSTICPGNTILLKTKPEFASYEWQDGSTDSVYKVVQPGKYYVKVSDFCGADFYDTVDVLAHPPISFDAGADRIKCNNDTVHINAPSGFMNYSWSPSYNISSTISRSVVVNPTNDTSYFVKAELTPGCFAYDTIKIKVHHSPAINLGNDTSFCYGKSALLNAGAGFDKYQWNDGSSQQTLSVNKAGTFSVTGITVEGCPSYDTLNVIKVWPLPVISIDHNSELCQSSVRTLDPGSFSSYLWQDGSTSRQYTVSSAGNYYVQITDYNGCENADTVSITTILPSPSNFLPNDTSICSYGTAELKPARSFASYTWSNGSSASKITVGKAGKYWLQVRDAKGCIGSDTVIVSLKDCMVGLRVPTAFTPNHDATNDIFRALLFGNVKSFDLTVYNRWGQVVFHTTDRFKGWDGTVNGVDQKPDVFVWLCKYQLQGDEQKVERGTVTLIR